MASHQITLTVSGEIAEKLRAQAASEGYATEHEFLEDHLPEVLERNNELEQWLATVGLERYDQYDANPNEVYSSEEVLRYAQIRLEMNKAG